MMKKKKNSFLTLFAFLSIIFIFLSLVTYNASDPSFSVVSSELPTNFCSYPGALISDLLMQMYGFVSYFIIFGFMFFLILKIKNGRIQYFPIKFFIFIGLILKLSILLSSVKKYRYKFQMMPGGYLGYFLHEKIMKFENGFLLIILIFFITIGFLDFLIFGKVFYFKIIKNFFHKNKNDKTNHRFSFKWFLYFIFKSFLFSFKSKIRNFNNHLKINKKHMDKNNKNEIEANNLKTDLQNLQTEDSHRIKKYTYEAPKAELFNYLPKSKFLENEIILKDNMKKLEQVLFDFAVKGKMISFQQGPVVTLYEFKPEPGIKSSRIVGLADDIARIMMVSSVRVFIISGKDTIGIEVPNKVRSFIDLRTLIETNEYRYKDFSIPLILGMDIFGNPSIVDLTTMPHLLIAGTTGSGKSVGVNVMILSILCRLSPLDCKLILIDPKMLEFATYNKIPHLLMEVITDAKRAILALQWAAKEMDARYRKMSEYGTRNIDGYNEKIKKDKIDEAKMPFIVVIIDEVADLMIAQETKKELEFLVQRIAQKARAAGIHLIMATQRPSVDVITGIIKANFPTRISYYITSKIDSRTILGEQGAERLLGKGDMLYMANGAKITRVHGCFVSDSEIEKVCNYLRDKYKYEYISLEPSNANLSIEEAEFNEQGADIYSQALEVVLKERKTSISYLQRRLRIGYNKAANLIEEMEKSGILSEPDPSGKRVILKD